MTEPAYEVEGLTDGRTADGTFVRVFWDWNSNDPEETSARARIAGAEHKRAYDLDEFARMLPHPAPENAEHTTDVALGPHSVTVPSQYLHVHLSCVLGQLRLMRGEET